MYSITENDRQVLSQMIDEVVSALIEEYPAEAASYRKFGTQLKKECYGPIQVIDSVFGDLGILTPTEKETLRKIDAAYDKAEAYFHATMDRSGAED